MRRQTALFNMRRALKRAVQQTACAATMFGTLTNKRKKQAAAIADGEVLLKPVQAPAAAEGKNARPGTKARAAASLPANENSGKTKRNERDVVLERRRRRRRILLSAITLLMIGTAVTWLIVDEALPRGEQHADADSLARRIMRAVATEEWDDVRAVRWTFAGRRSHLWDRDRDMLRVQFDEYEVYLNLSAGEGIAQGVAMSDGRRVSEVQRENELLATAREYWINDSFWLNPFTKLFDPGVTREIVRRSDGNDDLLVHFGRGGETPGDSYLISCDKNGLPTRWKMWVSLIPIGGLEATWEKWQRLPGGAKIAQQHRIAFLDLELTDIAGAPSTADLLPGGDPFVPLMTRQ